MGRVSAGTTLPRPPGLRGPLTRRRLVRTGALGGAFVLLGLLPTLLGGPVWLRAAGLVPGFGIVYATPVPGWSAELVPWLLLHLVVLLAVVAGLLTGVQRIMAKGDHLTLPAVVVASMLLAALLAAVHDGHGHVPQEWVPVAEVLAVVGFPAALLVRERRRERSARRVGDSRQARLDVAAREEWRPGPDERADEDDRARLARWAETLALQPAHEWNGFGRFGDEYLLPAMRYRVWAVFLMLATLRHTHTPAYCGYRDDALRALVLRMTDKPVWRYWLRENRWGMLRDSADPIGSPANVMYSGYLLLMLSAYRQATGDDSFDRPGALRFRWDDRTEFAYSHTDVAERVSANFRRSPLVLWPCEPGLVFPFCNSVAMTGLRMYDTCAGTRHAEEIAPRFLHRLRTEFTAPDGDICTLQAGRFGFTARSARGITNTAPIAALLSPLDPDFAWRTWELLVAEELNSGHYARTDRAGSPAPTDADWGGGANRANALGWCMFLARARSAPWYRRLRDAARNLENPPAEFRMFDASVHANGILGLGAVTDERTWRDMLLTPSRHTGPRLTEVPWPDIAVVTATTDGRSHEAILRGTDAAQRRHRLGFDRLIPHRTYTVDGATTWEVTADATGRAVVEIDLRPRHHLRLTRG
ncbi:linalool dehydratase/isomerase domain-containing protein [Saccharopolyspora endophytica]|uniref:Linalool dehydratase/isomerase domain-containing protein n=1 Tax=Saccharopolyspora endophytica TaxID=543886 RepID=A0ABS5DEZ2_9PSEU|nr:hypothetical protein [Saccharopolyspora endophytica]MBQ0924867.1 hypothetical protein [Saccharopolyspora endophytica]